MVTNAANFRGHFPSLLLHLSTASQKEKERSEALTHKPTVVKPDAAYFSEPVKEPHWKQLLSRKSKRKL